MFSVVISKTFVASSISRTALCVALGLSVAAGMANPAAAKRRHTGPAAIPDSMPLWKARPDGPIIIVVSIADERLTLYDNGVAVARTPVSTGVAGHLTPRGIFSVIQKDRHHKSNIYSDAPMPYMQRITWSGVALHEGHVTGHPASHGCIRMPAAFAQRLWPYTQIGVRVIVSDTDVQPVDFTHPKLFAAARHPATASLAPARPLVFAQADTATATDARAPAAEAADKPQTPPPEPIATPPLVTDETPAEVARTPDIPTSPLSADTVTGDPPVAALPAATATEEKAQVNLSAPETAAAPVTVEPDATTQARAPAVPADPVTAEIPAPEAPQVPVVVEAPAAAPAPAVAGTPPAEATPTEKSEPAPVTAAISIPPGTGHVAIFVSKKLGKLFVRRNFQPIFETPVVIRDPATPLGSHLFTAMDVTGDGAHVRWTVVDVNDAPPPEAPRRLRKGEVAPPPAPAPAVSTADEALDRIIVADEVRVALADLIQPGTSLIVSDQGFGRETGARGTDFIVLTR